MPFSIPNNLIGIVEYMIRARITVICTAEDLRHSLTALFHAYDFEVFEYSSIRQCIEKTISKPSTVETAAVAVVDLDLAREMELKALAELRRTLPWLSKVLAITPNIDGKLALKAKAAGAYHLFERPYMPSALVDAVKQMAHPE